MQLMTEFGYKFLRVEWRVEWRLLSEETLKNTTFVQLVIKRICFCPASKGNLLYFYFSLFFFSNIIIIFLQNTYVPNMEEHVECTQHATCQ